MIFKILLQKKLLNQMPTLCHQVKRLKPLQKHKLIKTMKKLFYLLAFLVASSMIVSACTEEEITPTTEEMNGGGAGSSSPK